MTIRSQWAEIVAECVETARERLHVPGVGVAWSDGDAEWAGGFGIAHADSPDAVRDTTLFQIASLSKTFTATALARLEDEGRLDLGSPVKRYLPDIELPPDPEGRELRVEDLLTHVAGWDGDHFFVGQPQPASLAELVSRMGEVARLIPGGTGYSYNNAAFCVAGRVLEVASGLPFRAALRELLLEPLEMRHTFLRADEVVTHRVAAPHLVVEGKPIVLRGGGWQPGWELSECDWPAAGVISCSADLLRWARFHLGDGSGPDGRRLIGQEALRGMRRARHANRNPRDGIGLGWMLANWGDHHSFGHTGHTVGYLSEIVIFERPRLSLTLLTNAVHGGELIRDVRDAVLARAAGVDVGLPVALAVAPAPLEDFLGTYEGPFWRIEVQRGPRPGQLSIHCKSRPADPHRWQPPPPPPSIWDFYAPDCVIAREPRASRGGRCEFGRDSNGTVVWLRSGLRIAPRRMG